MERTALPKEIEPARRARSTSGQGSALQARGRVGEKAQRPPGGGRRSRSGSQQPQEGNGGAGDEGDEPLDAGQQLQTYLDFLRSDMERNVVQLETSSQYPGQASYALAEAAYSASSCSGPAILGVHTASSPAPHPIQSMQEAEFVHTQCVPLCFADGNKLFWECGCSFHRGQCNAFQTIRTATFRSSIADLVQPCMNGLQPQRTQPQLTAP
jgi:hypothetical protein